MSTRLRDLASLLPAMAAGIAIFAGTGQQAHAQLATTVNYNHAIPAPPTGALNVNFQNDGGRPVVNFSAWVTYPTLQVACLPSGELSTPVSSLISSASSTTGAIVDARACTNANEWLNNVTINTPNILILLPCATITAPGSLIVGAGVRNVGVKGCNYQGGSASGGTSGGTAWAYTGSTTPFQVGDTTYALNTVGFTLTDMVINTAGASGGAQAIAAYRTQELDIERVYLQGDGSTGQVGIYFDGTSNYTGGFVSNVHISQFAFGVRGTGHMLTGTSDDYMNATTFTRVHIDCPTSGGNPVTGTIGVDIQGGDGNTWAGGDVEGCDTSVHFGSAATSNTFAGLRMENQNTEYLADAHSNFNKVITGETLLQGQLSDSGAQNSFEDSFHRAWNQINGDWYASQLDATLTDHERLGIGLGNERGRQRELQTDYGFRWEDGYSDGTSGLQSWFITDLLNSVNRFEALQYLTATANTVTNVVVNSGGCYSTSTPPALIFTGGGGTGAAGTALTATSSCSGGWAMYAVTMTNNGTGYTSQPTVSTSASNQTSVPHLVAEISTVGGTNDATAVNAAGTGAVILNGINNAGTGGTQFGSGGASSTTVASVGNDGTFTSYGPHIFIDAGVGGWKFNCASTSSCSFDSLTPTANKHHLRLYNGAGTDIDSEGTSGVTVNNSSGSGTGGFSIYLGGANYNTLGFYVGNSSGSPIYNFAGMTAGSGHSCVHVDTSGYMTATGTDCGTGTGSGSVTQVAMTVPSWLSVGGSPITSSGTLALTANTESANTFLRGPTSGSAAAPSFGALVSADIPNNAANTTGNASTATTAANATAVNGGSVPASACNLSTNGSSQPTANTCTGSGNTVLASGPTFTGNSTLFANGTASTQNIIIQAGTGGTNQVEEYSYNSQAGTREWDLLNTSGNVWELNDSADSLVRMSFSQNGGTQINSGNGSFAVAVNSIAGSGTGGFQVYGGGAGTPALAFSTNSSGNTVMEGYSDAKFYIGLNSMTFATETPLGSGSTVACASSHVCTGFNGTVTVITGTGPTTGQAFKVSFPNTHTNLADCVVNFWLPGTGQLSNWESTYDTTHLYITIDGTALTASTTYTLTYLCGGN